MGGLAVSQNRHCLWASTSKQATGLGILQCIRLSVHYRFIKFVLLLLTRGRGSWCQLKVCDVESARHAHTRFYGASMGLRKGLQCGLWSSASVLVQMIPASVLVDWPWDGHYKSILLLADEEIIGSSWCQLTACDIESARWAHPRCYGASVGFRKGLQCGSCVIHMKLQVCIGG